MISGMEEVRKINSIVSQKIGKTIGLFNLRRFKVRYEVSRPDGELEFPLEKYFPKPRRIFDTIKGLSDNTYGDIADSELLEYCDEICHLLAIEKEVRAYCENGFTSVEDAYFS